MFIPVRKTFYYTAGREDGVVWERVVMSKCQMELKLSHVCICLHLLAVRIKEYFKQ